jgi:hypothetical protein
MAIALSEFWSRFVRSGLTDANGCKQYAARYTNATRNRPPSDAGAVVEYLLEAN